jgi:NADPH-dependent ferric siderophore reductase
MSFVARLTVRRARRLSPSFVRVQLGGDLGALGAVAGATYDQRIKLVFPGPTGELPQLGQDSWWRDLRAVPVERRAPMRTYTLRAVHGSGRERVIVVDLVVHPGSHGPGSAWAQQAAPGDELIAVLPGAGDGNGGIEWPAGRTDRVLLAGDETAVPAVCSILEALPHHAQGTALLEVPLAGDALAVHAPPGITLRWLPRERAPVGTQLVPALLEALELASAAVRHDGGAGDLAEPAAPRSDAQEVWETPVYSAAGEPLTGSGTGQGDTYLWVAGESGAVGGLRRTLIGSGWTREQMSCMGYWRHGRAAAA